MSDDSTMRPRRGFLPAEDADEVDAETAGPAVADDHSAAPPQGRPRRGRPDADAGDGGNAARARHMEPAEDAVEAGPEPGLGSRLLARLRRGADTDDRAGEPAPEPEAAPPPQLPLEAHPQTAGRPGTHALIDAPPLVEAPAQGPGTEATGAAATGVPAAEDARAVEYELPIYREEPASEEAQARSPSIVGGGDDVHQHALFLPPDVEGSLSHTWILRALRDAEAEEEPATSPAAAGEGDLDDGASPTVGESLSGTTPPPAADGATEVPAVTEEVAVGAPGSPALLPRLLPWLAGGVLAALVIGAVVLTTTRKPAAVVTSAPNAASTDKAALVTTSDLLTAEAAKAIDGSARWTVASTLTSLDASSPVAACLQSPAQALDPRPTSTALRTLTSDSSKGLAALHQIDGFQSDNDARIVFESSRTSLGTCDALPMYIVGADAVTGLGDQSASVTVASQEKTATYHTVLLVRTGRVIDIVDVARTGSAVPASGLVKAASGVVSSQCAKAGGACPRSPSTVTSAPPTGRLAGWLEVSDLPRFTPGSGQWTTTEAGAVSTTTTQCEGMTLATVSGPRTRRQRTYLLTQDSLAPTNFGLDELKFGFGSVADAGKFRRTLGDNIGKCARTMPSATVSQDSSFTVDGNKTGVGTVSGRSFLITQKTGGTSSVSYRVAIAQLGNQVIYLMNNPAKDFGFDTGAIRAVAVRAAQRAAEVK